MNFIETITKRQKLNTEELVNELSERVDLGKDNQRIFSALGVVMLTQVIYVEKMIHVPITS
jgi:predicted DNA-binding ribbon-helix-helix protein